MKPFYRRNLIFIILLGIIVIGWVGYTITYNRLLHNDILSTDVDTKVFRPYILGTTIYFDENGNSSDFVNIADGWGGQEPEHRCAVGDQTVMRLYIPDSTESSLRMVVDAFGVYPPKTSKYQEITVFANDKEIGVWHVGLDGPFSIDIPNGIITDNTLTIKFVPASPYSPPPDVRRLSMAVRSIKIDRVLGAQTKRKVGKWIKDNLMGGGVKQEYDTDIVKDEDWQ